MPVIVTGTFILPDGEVAAGRTITLRSVERGVVSMDGSAVLPDDVVVQADAQGQVLFDLLPGNYFGFARTASGLSATFTLAVPDVTELDIADALNAPAVPLPVASGLPSGLPGQFVSYDSNGDPVAVDLAGGGVSISSDLNNALQLGDDGGLYVFETITPDGGIDLTVLFDNQLI